MELILASRSPRRKELLARLGRPFSVKVSSAPELERAASPELLVAENARRKAMALAREYPDALVLGSDTVVEIDGEVIGKPKDLEHARAILRKLSGRTHRVLTAINLIGLSTGVDRAWTEQTLVKFKPLSRQDIERYLDLVHVMDKAGAYGIQDHGEMLAAEIDGELENVIGLPLLRLEKELSELLKGRE
ncbi:MAG: nucleoside triphosphate pyrophosphatase [Victivallaceae bacterium]|nr:Maf family protein [Victivallaceae bacterium]